MLKFEESGLSGSLINAIREIGFQEFTPIQEKVIPIILESRTDIIALAQTGTGKTAAFALPLIQKTNVDNGHIQSLVLCPTRELCLQIATETEKYAKYTKGFSVVAVDRKSVV